MSEFSESRSCIELLDEALHTIDEAMMILEQLESIVGLFSSPSSEKGNVSKGLAYRAYVATIDLGDALRRLRKLVYAASEVCKR